MISRTLVAASLTVLTACAGPAQSQSVRPRSEPQPAAGPPHVADAELATMAAAAFEARDWRIAEPAYREMVRRNPDDAKSRRDWGTALLALERTDEAILELERAEAAHATAVGSHNLAIAYGSKRDFARAIASLRRATTLKPDYPQAWGHLVDALVRLRREPEALEAVGNARARCPSCGPGSPFSQVLRPYLMYNHQKSKAMFEVGNLAMAEAGVQVVLMIDPTFGDAYYNLAQIASVRGDSAAAESMYRKALSLYTPAEAVLAADAKNNLAFLLAGRKTSGAEALSLAREAIAVRGERPSYLDTLGRACDVVDDRACAREAYGKLLRLAGPDVPNEVVEYATNRLRLLDGGKP